MLKRFTRLLLTSLLVGCGAQTPPYPTYDPSLPFPLPASCPQTPYRPASALSDAMRVATPYWMGKETFAVGHVGGVAWHSGENELVWHSDEQPSVQANLLEGRSPPVRVMWQPKAGDLYRSTLTIPKIGCLEILAATSTQNLRLIVYVYSARYVP
ncbi:MAG: hypothetical protein C4294_19930 [Nitrospiraceae bacterium]